MLDWNLAWTALAAMVLLALAGWALSLMRKDVSIVDSLWSLFFLLGAGLYGSCVELGPRGALVLALVAIWALRLSVYLTWRNWGQAEDHRYQVIRARNQPHFAFKSLYLVFGLQALLAWIIAAPLFGALSGASSGAHSMRALDIAGAALWLIGFVFETVGDAQLARFKANPASRNRVLDTGLWRYTRHPNYFGEALLWWGYYLIALAAGAWWTVFAPVLMTLLLLKVSGVVLLEQDIAERRPAYADYIRRTNAFLPWPPRERT